MQPNESNLYKTIGRNLQEHRVRLMLTQSQVATAVNMQRGSICNIEHGISRPSLAVLYAICAVLKVEVKSILPTDAQMGRRVAAMGESMITALEDSDAVKEIFIAAAQGLLNAGDTSDPQAQS